MPEPEPVEMPQVAFPRRPAASPPQTRLSLTAAPTPPAPTATPPAAPALPASRPVLEPNGSHAAEVSHAATGPAIEPLVLGLTSLADTWPDAVRKEIVDHNLVDATVALPFEEVERALKHGKIVFTWKTVRSWIRPARPPSASAHDSACLELPLNVVAPVFIERQRQNIKPHQKISVDEDIPNLFFGFPQPEARHGRQCEA